MGLGIFNFLQGLTGFFNSFTVIMKLTYTFADYILTCFFLNRVFVFIYANKRQSIKYGPGSWQRCWKGGDIYGRAGRVAFLPLLVLLPISIHFIFSYFIVFDGLQYIYWFVLNVVSSNLIQLN